MEMGTVYQEKEESITRIYTLVPPYAKTIVTEKAIVEIAETEAFGTCLFIDGVMQFARSDEHIYHELLIHPLFCVVEPRQRVCILGGGDGMAAREVFKWDCVDHIDLVDWDPELVELSKKQFVSWNEGSLKNKHLTHHAQHAVEFLKRPVSNAYDAVVIDLLDPEFKDMDDYLFWSDILEGAASRLVPGGGLVLNMGSCAPENRTHLDRLFRLVKQTSWNEPKRLVVYRAFVPSFAAEWCFLLVLPKDTWHLISRLDGIQQRLTYLDKETWKMATVPRKDDPPVFQNGRTKLGWTLTS